MKMAKSSKSTGRSRVRFVMLDAEIEDGDFSEITQAIQNALAPRKVVHTQLISQSDQQSEVVADDDSVDGIFEEEPVSQPENSRRKRPASKRSFPTPEVVEIDWDTDPTIEAFVSTHSPKTTNDKYLVALTWLKVVAKKPSSTVNEVYTVFRKLKWSTAIKDFSQPIRDLKGQQVVIGGAKEGFSVNHLGEARVEEMAS